MINVEFTAPRRKALNGYLKERQYPEKEAQKGKDELFIGKHGVYFPFDNKDDLYRPKKVITQKTIIIFT